MIKSQKNEKDVKKGKTLQGTVVSSLMKDTIKVAVMRYVKHPKYKKFIKHVKSYLVHDVGNTAKVGDKVVIRETKPISKKKRFALVDNKTVNLEK